MKTKKEGEKPLVKMADGSKLLEEASFGVSILHLLPIFYR
jgi:hypothetical protein